MPDPQDQFAASIASNLLKCWKIICSFRTDTCYPFPRAAAGCQAWQIGPWARLAADVFYPNPPVIYSDFAPRTAGCPARITTSKVHPIRRLYGGAGLEDGAPPSMAERSANHAIDTIKSELVVGKPVSVVSRRPGIETEYANLKIRSLKPDIIKAFRAIRLESIWDALLFIFIVLGLVLLLIAPIWLSLRMPTGS